MTREIKFRGMRVDNSEWVYGHFHYSIDIDGYHRARPTIREYIKNAEGEIVDFTSKFVDPATVGQFTGLKDKNGVEIFEGDNCTAEAWEEGCVHEVRFGDCAFYTKVEGVDYPNDMTLFMCSKYKHSDLYGQFPRPHHG